jgi:hypothetical protein
MTGATAGHPAAGGGSAVEALPGGLTGPAVAGQYQLQEVEL